MPLPMETVAIAVESRQSRMHDDHTGFQWVMIRCTDPKSAVIALHLLNHVVVAHAVATAKDIVAVAGGFAKRVAGRDFVVRARVG